MGAIGITVLTMAIFTVGAIGYALGNSDGYHKGYIDGLDYAERVIRDVSKRNT